MAGQEKTWSSDIKVDEIGHLPTHEQAEKIASHYAFTRNQYKPISESDFQPFLDKYEFVDISNINLSPSRIQNIIKAMNKKSSTLLNDLPMKIIWEYKEEFSYPLSHIFYNMIKNGVYPRSWKREIITPAPKVFPLTE